MTRERFRLAKYVNGRTAYAEVEISIGTADDGTPSVVVADHVFAWLEDAYGPGAWEWAICDAYRAAAMRGVELVLADVAPRVEASVCIECIRVTVADSSEEAVVYAAAHATWRALNLPPTRALTIDGVEIP